MLTKCYRPSLPLSAVLHSYPTHAEVPLASIVGNHDPAHAQRLVFMHRAGEPRRRYRHGLFESSRPGHCRIPPFCKFQLLIRCDAPKERHKLSIKPCAGNCVDDFARRPRDRQALASSAVELSEEKKRALRHQPRPLSLFSCRSRRRRGEAIGRMKLIGTPYRLFYTGMPPILVGGSGPKLSAYFFNGS